MRFLRQKQKTKEMLKNDEINFSELTLIIFTVMTFVFPSVTLTGLKTSL